MSKVHLAKFSAELTLTLTLTLTLPLPLTLTLTLTKVHLAKFSAEVRPARRLGVGSLTAEILRSLAASLTEP